MGTKVSSENKEVINDRVNYAWRPATRGDIGSVARFCNYDPYGNRQDWKYGILDAISSGAPFRYECSTGVYFDWWDVCEIQYVADDEP